MAINYIIQADVVDITADTPKAGDVFLVDTNVWYWLTYTRAIIISRSASTSWQVYVRDFVNSMKVRVFQHGSRASIR